LSHVERRAPRSRRRIVAATAVAGVLAAAGVVSYAIRQDSAVTASADTDFFDDFTGPAGSPPDPAIWSFETGDGGWGNNELQTYTTTNAVLDGDSHLVISARIDAALPVGERYTSSRLTTKGTVTPTFGTVEARIKLPDGEGLLPAFWMLGTNIDEVGYPASGEIDIVETPFSTGYSSHLLHGPGVGDDTRNVQTGDDVTHDVPLSAEFHTYGAVRSPGRIELTIDGETVADISRASAPDTLKWVFDEPFYLLMNIAIGGNWPGEPTEATPARADMIVDWVRVTGQ
jgi:beta-glucanase (GH16 family)